MVMWLRGYYRCRACKYTFHEPALNWRVSLPIAIANRDFVCPSCGSRDYEWRQVASPI